MIFNHIGRAYGILAMRTVFSKETMNLLSLLRLGVDLGLFPGTDGALVDELFLITSLPICKRAFGESRPKNADLLRADMLRDGCATSAAPIRCRTSERVQSWTS